MRQRDVWPPRRILARRGHPSLASGVRYSLALAKPYTTHSISPSTARVLPPGGYNQIHASVSDLDWTVIATPARITSLGKKATAGLITHSQFLCRGLLRNWCCSFGVTEGTQFFHTHTGLGQVVARLDSHCDTNSVAFLRWDHLDASDIGSRNERVGHKLTTVVPILTVFFSFFFCFRSIISLAVLPIT